MECLVIMYFFSPKKKRRQFQGVRPDSLTHAEVRGERMYACRSSMSSTTIIGKMKSEHRKAWKTKSILSRTEIEKVQNWDLQKKPSHASRAVALRIGSAFQTLYHPSCEFIRTDWIAENLVFFRKTFIRNALKNCSSFGLSNKHKKRRSIVAFPCKKGSSKTLRITTWHAIGTPTAVSPPLQKLYGTVGLCCRFTAACHLSPDTGHGHCISVHWTTSKQILSTFSFRTKQRTSECPEYTFFTPGQRIPRCYRIL